RPTRRPALRRARCWDTFGAAMPSASDSSVTVIGSRSRSSARIRNLVGSDSRAKRRAASSIRKSGTVTPAGYRTLAHLRKNSSRRSIRHQKVELPAVLDRGIGSDVGVGGAADALAGRHVELAAVAGA